MKEKMGDMAFKEIRKKHENCSLVCEQKFLLSEIARLEAENAELKKKLEEVDK